MTLYISPNSVLPKTIQSYDSTAALNISNGPNGHGYLASVSLSHN